MSFAKYHDKIEEGDVVVVHIGFKNMLALKIKLRVVTQTKYGAIRHSDLLGVRYGSKIKCSKGWVYVLYPTPELWTLTLPHRTQILYSPDISLIIFNLDLKPGSTVAESGTGSGSLSHALIRTIMPTGHLYTFDFHAERVEQARADFVSHGLGEFVTVRHKDACRDGFGLDHIVDAVFLDLPQPWDAIESAVNAIKVTGGRICSFSPCIEQVQKTCAKLREQRFEDIETIECVQRSLDARKCSMPRADLGLGRVRDGTRRKRLKSGDFDRIVDRSSGLLTDGKDSFIECNEGEFEKCVEKSDETIDEVYSTGKRAQESQERTKESNSAVYESAVRPASMLGHTGFLTFASLYDASL